MYKVSEIENAILEVLAADETLASYVRAFMPLPSLDEEALKNVIRQFPAIGVISQGGTYDYASSNVQTETGSFLILCFNRNLRSPVAMVRGTEDEKGLWDLVDDCRRVILAGNLDDVNLLECIARRRMLLFAGEHFAVAALEVEAQWRNL